ncbi:MAG: hypothetical protein LBV07_01300, partial [Syntrophobacterales bacterium]|nr:hypothetical protein [Syntrophobacterales bacterium]
VKKAEIIDPVIRGLIEGEIENGCVSCASLLKIAAQHQLSPITVAEVCEAIEVKIKPCQLGAF